MKILQRMVRTYFTYKNLWFKASHHLTIAHHRARQPWAKHLSSIGYRIVKRQHMQRRHGY